MRHMGSDSPGASARREHARRRTARERALRERHPRIGGVLFALEQAPAHERAWERGAEGEERAAARLERLLAGSGVVLLHDRRMPGTRANIDHLAVGPGGLTVIDTKRLTGRVDVRGRGDDAELRVAGRRRSKLLDGAERQLAAVRAVAVGIDVRAALCFVETSGLPLLRRLEPRGILIDGPRGVARLAARSGQLEPAAVRDLVARLDRELPPAPR
jgi:Nuclease-related domain